jgi:hypothetical protein
MIKHNGNKFFVKIFNPCHSWKYAGKVIDTVYGKAFVTHTKIPDKHFFVKGLGYPVNHVLLKELRSVGVVYLIIPEDGKRGFKAYLGLINDYLNGEIVVEPLTDEQRCLPLGSLKEIPVVDVYRDGV